MHLSFVTIPCSLPTATARTRRIQPPTMRTAAPDQIAPIHTPTRWRIPFLASVLNLFTDNGSIALLPRQYGPVYKMDYFGLPVTVISDLNAIKSCYKDTETYRSKDAYPPNLSNALGVDNILDVDGAHHTPKRSIIAPAFTSRLFPLYFRSIHSQVTDMWNDTARIIKERGTIKMADQLRVYTMKLIMELTMGIDTDSNSTEQEDLHDTMCNLFLKVQSGIQTVPFSPTYLAGGAARRQLVDMLSDLISERLETRADIIEQLRTESDDGMSGLSQLRQGKLDLLTLMAAESSLSTGPGVEHNSATLKEIGQLIVAVWYGGFATQSNAIASALLEIGFDDELLARLREEQDALVSAAGSVELTYKQTTEMPLLDSFTTEVTRIHPPGEAMFRRISRETTVLGHRIPKGRLVMLDIAGAQRDAKYYPEPDVLKPERFMKGMSGGGEAPGIVAFGVPGGAHYCVGRALSTLTQKTILAMLLRERDMVLDPHQSRKWRAIMENEPSSGVDIIGLEKRKTLPASGEKAH